MLILVQPILKTMCQDVNIDDLFSELRVLQKTLLDGLISAISILEFVKEDDCFPNALIACRILLTVPLTVASVERSFSKLKILKKSFKVFDFTRAIKWSCNALY